MNFSNFFVDMLSSSDSQISYGTKKSDAPAFLFSDIMKVFESDTTNVSEPNQQTIGTVKEIFSSSENVFELQPEDFNSICDLIAQLVNQTTEQQPTNTVYNVDQATIIKQKFLLQENHIVDFLGNLVEKGGNSLDGFLSQIQPGETNSPIILSFKSESNKITISLRPINISENYTNQIVSDESGLVNQLLVNENLFKKDKEVIAEKPFDDNFIDVKSEEEIDANDNLTAENNNGIYFRAEIIKIISENQQTIIPELADKSIGLNSFVTSVSAFKNFVSKKSEIGEFSYTDKTGNPVNNDLKSVGNPASSAVINPGSNNESITDYNQKYSDKIVPTDDIKETQKEPNISIANLFDGLTEEERKIFQPMQKTTPGNAVVGEELLSETKPSLNSPDRFNHTNVEEKQAKPICVTEKSELEEANNSKSFVNEKSSIQDESKVFVRLNNTSFRIAKSDSFVYSKQASDMKTIPDKQINVNQNAILDSIQPSISPDATMLGGNNEADVDASNAKKENIPTKLTIGNQDKTYSHINKNKSESTYFSNLLENEAKLENTVTVKEPSVEMVNKDTKAIANNEVKSNIVSETVSIKNDKQVHTTEGKDFSPLTEKGFSEKQVTTINAGKTDSLVSAIANKEVRSNIVSETVSIKNDKQVHTTEGKDFSPLTEKDSSEKQVTSINAGKTNYPVNEDKNAGYKELVNSKESGSENSKTIKNVEQENQTNSNSGDDSSKNTRHESFKNVLSHVTNDFNIEKANAINDSKPNQEPAKIIKPSEIIPEFTKVIQQGEKQTMTFQVTPENLGKVKLTVDLVNNQVQTKIEVENEQVKQFIQKNVEQLKQNLQASGIQLTNVNISLPDYNPKHADRTFAMKRKNNFKEEKEIIAESISEKATKKMGYNTYEYLA